MRRPVMLITTSQEYRLFFTTSFPRFELVANLKIAEARGCHFALASVTGRVGYVANNWLRYAKGGWAWAEREGHSAMINTLTGVTTVITRSSGKPSGWTVGAGTEYRFDRNWSALVEYAYVELGISISSVLVTFAAPGAAPVVTGSTLLRDVSADIHLVKFGVNCRF